MTKLFVEDVLETFIDKLLDTDFRVTLQDSLILGSFHAILKRGDNLTKSQGILLLKLLGQYKDLMLSYDIDCEDVLTEPQWKSKFRSLDLTKKISVSQDSDGAIWVNLKFPYRLKKSFEDEIEAHLMVFSKWDPEYKLRKIPFHDSNLLELHDFAIKYGFELDKSFLDAFSTVEEILSQQENIAPTSRIIDNQVSLVNASPDAEQWWNENKNGNLNQDLLLAKSMGFILDKTPESLIEKIASSEPSLFWQESTENFFEVCKNVNGKICILLDRADRSFEWLKKLISTAEGCGFRTEEIKICFRNDSENDQGFNQWVKDSGYGGPVESGKILIFNHKPAKWVFKNPKEIKIIATNNYYPHTDPHTRDWIDSHPCVIFIGNVKPSKLKEQKIVQL